MKPMVYAKRPAVRKTRAELTRVIAAFLTAQAPKIAGQVQVMRGQLGKADVSQDELDAIDRILNDLDFAGWSVLAGDVEPLMQEIVEEGSYAALAQVGIDVSADSGIAGVVSRDAVEYAQERAAELVGKRRDALGRLTDNPNAEWRIDEGTREFLRASVTQAITEGTSNEELSRSIRESYGFSKERAEVIARTETNLAANAGALNGYKASGVVDGKQWLTADDDLVSEECQANGEAGPNGDGVLLDLDADYPSGDSAPPVHPNCRCTLAPYIAFANEAAPADEE